jgi:hypothetical protein
MLPNSPGYFEIQRLGRGISFDDFYEQYFIPEIPVVLEKLGEDWPACRKWNQSYLQNRLADESSVLDVILYLQLNWDVMAEDFTVPEIVDRVNQSADVFDYEHKARIWINSENNVSTWHYDASFVNNFNAQVTGKKEFTLVSPQTPRDCYPFSNFVILNDDESILKGSIYTKFILNQGDILYIPPLWYHTVKAITPENINLSWLFTKQKTTVSSPCLIREEQRYRIYLYLSQHPSALIRKIYFKFLTSIPGFLTISWKFDNFIETPLQHSRINLVTRIFKELAMLGKTILTIPEIRRTLREAEKAPTLNKDPKEADL